MPKPRVIFLLLGGMVGPLAALLLYIFAPRAVTEAENKTTDYRARLVGPAGADKRVVIITLDDQTAKVIGPYPWPRRKFADLFRRLHAMGAGVIAFDIYIDRPSDDPAQDQQLAAAISETQKVVFPLAAALEDKPPVEGEDLSDESLAALQPFLFRFDPEVVRAPVLTGSRPLVPALVSQSSAVGHLVMAPDSDKVFRRMPLFIRVRDKFLPALALAALQPLKLYDFGRITWKGRFLILPSLDSGRTPSLRIPLDKRGNLIINWSGAWDEKNPLQGFSARYVLDSSPPPEKEKEMTAAIPGSICVVGRTDTAAKDFIIQPFEKTHPGVGVHAALINTLLSGNFRSQSGAAALVFYLLLLSFPAVVSGFISRPWAAYLLGLAVFPAYGVYSVAALLYLHTFIPLFLPLLSFLLSFATVMVIHFSEERRQMQCLRANFEKLLSSAVLQQIENDPETLTRQGPRRELSVMFADITAFCDICDKEEPETVQEMLSEYFDAMTEIIFRHGGTIDKFIGDGILALWGAPLPMENHALKAVKAGIEMQAAVRGLNAKCEKRDRPGIRIRIGINTGFVNVGFFGSEKRREYTVVGREVNKAQRLETNCRPGHILVFEKTARLIAPEISSQSIGKKKLKGFPDPVEVFEITCAEPAGGKA